MRYIVNLALMKSQFVKYEDFYQAHHGQDMKHIAQENNYLKRVVRQLQEEEELKYREIARLKATVNDLSKWTFETKNEMNRKDNELFQVKSL